MEQEQKNELQDRVEQFLKEYGELVEKLKIDFACYPMFVPDGQGSFKVIVQNTPVDTTQTSVKSPFIE